MTREKKERKKLRPLYFAESNSPQNIMVSSVLALAALERATITKCCIAGTR